MISNREKLIDEWLWECEDRGYTLEDSSISMDNRRKYDYITNANGISINSEISRSNKTNSSLSFSSFV